MSVTIDQAFVTRQRERLIKLERELQENLSEQREEYDELARAERVEPVDEAQVRMDSHNRGALRLHDEELLTRVRSAIQRAEGGRYGICAACGGPVLRERLEVKPEAMFCIACERRHELE